MDRAPRRSLLSLPTALKYGLFGFGLAGALGCSSTAVPVDGGGADRPAITDAGDSDARRDVAADPGDAPPADLATDTVGDTGNDTGSDLALDTGETAGPLCDGGPGSDRIPVDQNISDALPDDRARYHQCVPEIGSGVERCDPYIVQEPEPCPPGCRACKELVSALDCFVIGAGPRKFCTPTQVCEDEPDPPCCECLH